MAQEQASKAETRISPRTVLLLLALLCGTLYFVRLGSIAFYEEDEPRFASAARGILESGDWLTPRFNGKLRINKPILFYWLAAPSDAVFGRNELGARFPSAVLCTALVFMLFFFARHYGSTRFAAIAAVAFATSLQFAVVLGRAATADMTMIFFFSAALLAFFRAYTDPPGRRWILLFWGALGFTMLAKGPAFIIMAGAIIGLFLLLRGELGPWVRRLLDPLGLLAFLGVAVPWYAAEFAVLGKTFWEGFFVAEHLGRYEGKIDPHHQPFFFFFAVLPLLFYPWASFLPAGLVGALRERKREAPLRLFLFCWIVVAFLLPSFSVTKHPHYIAPLYPAAALLVAWVWEQRLAGEGRHWTWGLAKGLLGLVGGVFTLLFAALAIKGPKLLHLPWDPSSTLGPGPALIALCFAVSWIGALALMKRKPGAAVAVLAGSVAAAVLAIHVLLAPVVARYWQDPLRDLSVEAAARGGSSAKYVLWNTAASGVVYYSRQVWERVQPEEASLLAEMARRGPLFVITTEKGVQTLPPEAGLVEMDRRPNFDTRGPYVLLGPAKGTVP